MRCSCSGNSEVDNKGDHLSKCRKGKEIFATHDAVKQEIVAFCRSNGLHARAEINMSESKIQIITNAPISQSEDFQLTCS